MKAKIINSLIKIFKIDTKKISDGYHTFEELYDHRKILFVELMRNNKEISWWSNRLSNGRKAFGYPYVIAGINTKAGKQITYHLNIGSHNYSGDWIRIILEKEIKKLDFAPTYDQHTPADVLFRLHTREYLIK